MDIFALFGWTAYLSGYGHYTDRERICLCAVDAGI